MRVYLICSLLFTSANYNNAEEKNELKSFKTKIIHEIMDKVSNITLNTLAKVSPDKKGDVLKAIRKKLEATASGLKGGQRYVDIIMEEFQKKADNLTRNDVVIKKLKNNHVRKVIKDTLRLTKKDEIRAHKIKIHKVTDNSTKEGIIIDIANKIEAMAKGYLRNDQSLAQKEKVLEKIKNKILESSNRKHLQIHNQHHQLKAYTDLISNGFNLSVKRLLNLNSRRFTEMLMSQNSGYHAEPAEPDDLNTHINLLEHVSQYKLFFSEIHNSSINNPHCGKVVKKICSEVQHLNRIACNTGRFISIEQLCDGKTVCWAQTNEKNCTTQATNKIQEVIYLLNDIGRTIPNTCMFDGEYFSYNNLALLNTLKSRLQILHKHTPPSSTLFLSPSMVQANIQTNNIIDEIRVELGSLFNTFKTHLCENLPELNKVAYILPTSFKSGPNVLKEVTVSVNDDVPEVDPRWTPKSCQCEKGNCKTEKCDGRCKLICWQKHVLVNWECRSITGKPTVPLDFVCDGKLDCYDESDEQNCFPESSMSKYEANNIYKDILDVLSLKSISVEYEHSSHKMHELLNATRQLQTHTTKTNVDLYDIKIVREMFFKMLQLIFVDSLKSSDLLEISRHYDFLLQIKNKMLKALKHSHMGNELLASTRDCLCNNGTCSHKSCSPKCEAVCAIEPVMINFDCNVNNKLVNIQSICNDKLDCPNEEDENNCNKEACRAHHLRMLSNELQTIIQKHKGTSLGETMEIWRTKVFSTILVGNRNQRPTRNILVNIIAKLLQDLVHVYGTIASARKSLPNTRRSDSLVQDFKEIADVVKLTLKKCGI